MPEPIITIPIKWITDKNKQNFFPVTHLNAVRNTQNENLTVLLGRKQDMITSDNKLSWDLVDHPDLPTVNDATLTIQKNGTTVQTFTANASSNKTANITVPTSAADVNALPSSTKYGASLVLSIDSTTYVVTAQLKDQDGNNLGSAQTVDLPLESVVVSGSYDAATKKVILTLQNGSTIDFSVADLISGLQTEITAQNPLSADLITDGNTNKVYTATEKTKLSGIASGAEVNVQSDWNVTSSTSDAFIKNKPTIGNATITLQKNGTNVDSFTTNATNNKTINIAVPTKTSDLTNDGDGTNAFLTQHQDISGKQDKITSTNKLSADLISDGTTNKAYTATEKTKLNGIAAGAEVNVQSDWNVVDSSSDAFIKNKPAIGNGTLTIWQNQTSKGTFTANQATNADITISVPTKTSELTNDSGFLTGNSKLNSLQDVTITSPVNEQSLVYENGIWVNKMVQSSPTPITYDELVALRNNSNLVPNTTYRITDYVTEINPYMTNLIYYWGLEITIYDMEIARVSPDYVQYDILATAIDDSHLSEDCRMVPHSGVTFFDDYDITSWKLKYTIDNDVERFAWAKNYYDVTLSFQDGTVSGVMIKTKLKSKVNNVDGYDTYLFTAKINGECTNAIFAIEAGHTPAASETIYEVMQNVSVTISSAAQVLGKGVVYSMEDCFSNKLCYDYLNIQYKLFAITDITSTDTHLSDHITGIKTSMIYNAAGTKARLSSIVSTLTINSTIIRTTTDFNNSDWYYTFDMYDETNDTHTNVFYLCDSVTLEKSLSSCWYMYGMGPEAWNLPYNVFQYNKSYLTGTPLAGDESGFGIQKHILLHSLDLSECVYGNVWYYDVNGYTIYDNDMINYFLLNDVESAKHVYGTIFVNCLRIKAYGCLYGKFVSSANVNTEGSQDFVSYKLFDSTIGQLANDIVLINDKNLVIGTSFHKSYICNCESSSVGNNGLIKLTGRADNMSNISIGNNSYVELFTDPNSSSTSIQRLIVGNNVYPMRTVDSESFTGTINRLTIGDNCDFMLLKKDLYCECVVVEPCSSSIILTSESLPSGYSLSNIIIRSQPNLTNYYGHFSTDFITESFKTMHRVGRNSSGVSVCYVEEDLVAPAAYAPNGVTYTVSGNVMTFTIPSNYTMYWTLDGRNPSQLVNDGSASSTATVTLTDGQTIKYISYNSSLPKDRWATQVYSYTHHVV